MVIHLNTPPSFQDIPQFTQWGSYAITIPWYQLQKHITKEQCDAGLDMDPDFQRGHVWTESQYSRYVEFCLQGGKTSRELLFNCKDWHSGGRGDYVLVDGKQRTSAVLKFLNNEIKAFGHYYKEFKGELRVTTQYFIWHVNDLHTKAEVLQWYLDLNSGGIIHSEEDLGRVRNLLANLEK